MLEEEFYFDEEEYYDLYELLLWGMPVSRSEFWSVIFLLDGKIRALEDAMAQIVAFINANGHMQSVAISQPELSLITDVALVLGSVVYINSSGHFSKNDGVEANNQAVVGVSDGTYAMGATASAWTTGQIATLTGLTAGKEYWSKDDGTLDLETNITSGKAMRPMGVSLSTTLMQLEIGDVKIKP